MASQITFCRGASALWQALRLTTVSAALCVAGGCQSDGELAHTKNGVGGALSPVSVDEYARRRGIPAGQARQELQKKVGEQDAEEAVQKIDEIGTVSE